MLPEPTLVASIIDLRTAEPRIIEETAALLWAAFQGHTPAWPDLASAREEVADSLDADRISRVALTADGRVSGWIAGQSIYDGHVWELHPLAVTPAFQGRGVGRALVVDFEVQVRARGGQTIYLGTDDEDERTTLGGVDLFPDVLAKVARIGNLRRHPYEFYVKLGYTIVGVVPDANGPGKPDIMLAKRVSLA